MRGPFIRSPQQPEASLLIPRTPLIPLAFIVSFMISSVTDAATAQETAPNAQMASVSSGARSIATATPRTNKGGARIKLSTYGPWHHGNFMAYTKGSQFDMNNPLILAHWTLPADTKVLLTTDTGVGRIACVYDRGPHPRITKRNGTSGDTSTALARALGFQKGKEGLPTGHMVVTITVVGTCPPYQWGRHALTD